MVLRLATCFFFLVLVCFSDARGGMGRSSGGRGISVGRSSSSGRPSISSRKSQPSSYGWNGHNTANTVGGKFGQGQARYTSPNSHSQSHPGHSNQPGFHYNPAAMTYITINPQSNRGVSQIAKEAFVHSMTTAAVNHMIYGRGIYGSWNSPWGSSPGHFHSHSTVVNNYYYNNGSTQSDSGPPGFVSKSGQKITLTKFQQLTEDLLKKDAHNAASYIRVNLQRQKTDDSTTDDAPERLLAVSPVAWSVPTIKAVLDLYNSYNMDVHVKEVITDDRKKKEDAFLDLILQTEVMNDTMKFLVDNGYVKNNRTEFKQTLRDIWFWQFERTSNITGSSGFETVFLAEKFDSDIIGLHNWIYYAKMESNRTLNYLGYIRHVSLGHKGAVCKVRSSLNGNIQPVTSIFVGTSPEFEIAIYILCFYTLPNQLCPVKLADKDIVITVNAYNISGKNVIVSAYPDIWVEPPPVPDSGRSQVPFSFLGLKMCLLVLILVFSI